VSLGWREVVPQTRSRGGEARRPHTPTESIVHSAKLDSGLNSLEYWDYSVELECLSGPEGRRAWSKSSTGTTVLNWNVSLDFELGGLVVLIVSLYLKGGGLVVLGLQCQTVVSICT
jgi:hypothetical protein